MAELIYGRVLKVQLQGDNLAISGGTDNGIAVGQSVVITREDKHVAAGLVTRTSHDVAVCQVTNTVEIEVGDVAKVVSSQRNE